MKSTNFIEFRFFINVEFGIFGITSTCLKQNGCDSEVRKFWYSRSFKEFCQCFQKCYFPPKSFETTKKRKTERINCRLYQSQFTNQSSCIVSKWYHIVESQFLFSSFPYIDIVGKIPNIFTTISLSQSIQKAFYVLFCQLFSLKYIYFRVINIKKPSWFISLVLSFLSHISSLSFHSKKFLFDHLIWNRNEIFEFQNFASYSAPIRFHNWLIREIYRLSEIFFHFIHLLVLKWYSF